MTKCLNLFLLKIGAILTFNRKDFFRLHKKDNKHSGIIACTYDNHYEALARRIKYATDENEPLNGNLSEYIAPTIDNLLLTSQLL